MSIEDSSLPIPILVTSYDQANGNIDFQKQLLANVPFDLNIYSVAELNSSSEFVIGCLHQITTNTLSSTVGILVYDILGEFGTLEFSLFTFSTS